MAAITPQFMSSKTVSVTLTDLGLSGAASSEMQSGVVALQIDPLAPELAVTPDSGVDVPGLGGIVSAAGEVVKPLATSFSDYVWRLRMTDKDKSKFSLSSDTVSFQSSGSATGTLYRTTNPVTERLTVTIIPGSLAWTQSSSWYCFRTLNLEIDLSNVRYSGTYRGNFTTTLAY